MAWMVVESVVGVGVIGGGAGLELLTKLQACRTRCEVA
jgi:hypothetical protein